MRVRGLIAGVLLALGFYAPAPALAESSTVVRVMVIDLKAKGVDANLARTLTDTIATALSKAGPFSVASSDDVATMLRHTEEKQLVGCNDEACFAGLANILGAQFVVHGSVGKVGDSYVLNVSRLDVSKGTVTERVSETAKVPDEFLSRVEAVTRGLIGTVGPAKKRDEVPVDFIRTRQQAVWAAVQYDRAKKSRIKRPKHRYVASFGSEHFKFDDYDRLENFYPLKPDLWFPGRYPSCFGRSESYEDAFSVKEERPLVIKVGQQTGYELLKLHRRRKLVLDVEFEIVGARIYQMKEYDWRSCDGDTKPFNPSDVSPNAWIRVKAAVLKDMFNGRRYAVTRQQWDPETERVTLVSLPEPPVDPEADESVFEEE